MSYVRLNEIVNGRRGVTPDTALRFGRLFGTTPDFWLNAQLACDLYEAQRKLGAEVEEIKPLEGSPNVPSKEPSSNLQP